MSRRRLGAALLVAGYPVSLASLTRFNHMVRERDLRTLLVLEAGTASLVAGFSLLRIRKGALSNLVWLAAFPAWYRWRGSRQR